MVKTKLLSVWIIPLGLLAACDVLDPVDKGGISHPPVPPPEFARDPAWSPDGNSIAFAYFDYFGPPTDSPFEIWIADVATGEGEHVAYGWNPDWSPDSQELVADYRGSIYKLTLTTRDVTWLTDSVRSHFPQWSPDGEHIVWTRYGDGRKAPEQTGIWLIRPDGTGMTKLANSGSHPDWSPDGSKIAYSAYDPDKGGAWLWVMNRDGSDKHTLELPVSWTRPDSMQSASSPWPTTSARWNR